MHACVCMYERESERDRENLAFLFQQMLMDEAKDLPLAIYRPSIIGASLKEPVEV